MSNLALQLKRLVEVIHPDLRPFFRPSLLGVVASAHDDTYRVDVEVGDGGERGELGSHGRPKALPSARKRPAHRSWRYTTELRALHCRESRLGLRTDWDRCTAKRRRSSRMICRRRQHPPVRLRRRVHPAHRLYLPYRRACGSKAGSMDIRWPDRLLQVCCS